jgi:hypothetical protein
MASTSYIENCSGISQKMKVAVSFLKYPEIAMASIQLIQHLKPQVEVWVAGTCATLVSC